MHSREVAAAVEQNAGSVHRVLSSNKSSGEYPRDNSPGLLRSREVRLPVAPQLHIHIFISARVHYVSCHKLRSR